MTKKSDEIILGTCKTDHKSGKTFQYRADYIFDAAYQDFVQRSLALLGIPPITDSKNIHRGTHHDLLFVDSHGLVIRIGPMDIPEMLNPAILQPLGWFDMKRNEVDTQKHKRISIAIYPGIDLMNMDKVLRGKQARPLFGYGTYDYKQSAIYEAHRDLMHDGGNNASDMIPRNTGLIAIEDMLFPILLDMDSKLNEGISPTQGFELGRAFIEQPPRYRAKLMHEAMTKVIESDSVKRWGERNYITKLFNQSDALGGLLKLFEFHQPLRRAFWHGFHNPDEPDLKLFMAMARNWRQHGYKIYKHKNGAEAKNLHAKDFRKQSDKIRRGIIKSQKYADLSKNAPEGNRIQIETRHLVTPWQQKPNPLSPIADPFRMAWRFIHNPFQ